MSEKKNLDRLFQERLKDFETEPNPAVWDRISTSLGQKKKRRIVPIWWRIGGIAATVALLLTVGSFIFSDKLDAVLPVVNTHSEIKAEDDTNSSSNTSPSSKSFSTKELTDSEVVIQSNEQGKTKSSTTTNNSKNTTSNKHTNSENKSALVNGKSNTVTQNTSGDDTNSLNNSTEINSETLAKTNSKVTSNDTLKTDQLNKADTKVADTNNPLNNTGEDKTETQIDEKEINSPTNSIETAIAEANPINEKEKENQDRWSIAPSVAPVYYNSLTSGSTIGSQFNTNSSSNDINMSYGLKGSYALSNSLKLRAGINVVNLNYTTNDVIVYSGSGAAARGVTGQSNNIVLRPEMSSVTILSRTIINSDSAPEIVNTKYNGTLDQRFSYIELPLELEYEVIDGSINLNVIGGFSALFLNSNEIYADIEGTNTLIGESNNINNTSYTANFGIGLSYGITEHLNLNLEPTFKYQINGFNNTSGDFQPFFVGLYSGISFKF
ncbi:MAG: outer membrane beta-barrel protein [Bacteroidia bacterium]|nr:outer membrane beta-barrel protein [Bacteroidia bacterium]